MKKLLKFVNGILRPVTKKPSYKHILVFFVFLLIPNILRQIVYWRAKLSSGSIAFIDSPETRLIFKANFPYLGILEEMIIAMVFTFLWFNYLNLRFFAYGWLADAFFDFVFVLLWLIYGSTPLQMIGFSSFARFLIREGAMPYLIFGPLLAFLKPDIRKLVIACTFFGAFMIGFILVI